MKKILVTGGAGFIGTHLSRKLVSLGHEVTVLDLVSPDDRVPKVRYVLGDVRNNSDLVNLVPAQDVVFHFAAQVSVPECQLDPWGSYQTNEISTLTILNLIEIENRNRKDEAKIRIVFSSSSAVYGELGNTGNPISENTLLPEPLSFYGAQKLGSEQMIRLYSKTRAIPAVVFRFFNVYGPGQKANSPYSGVISWFIHAIREDKSILLNGGGSQTRDFISVHDVVSACAEAATTENQTALQGLPMNLGTGRTITIKLLAQMIFEIFDKPNRANDGPPRDGDILHSCGDPSRAKTLLNWSPVIQLQDGLKMLCSLG